MKRTLGVCYYPEHWPRAHWAEDAKRMVEAGLTWARIGEFAWSEVEPEEGRFTWEWLDAAIDTLGQAGLKVVLGTPSATPPHWVVTKYPDMLAVDADGRPRKFGSRRHYCFSHTGFEEEAVRITEAYAERYGANPYVAAWQTDNEYGCHDTVLSFSDAARHGFRAWLAEQFDHDITALNTAWGNVFWSMTYPSFEAIDLPNLTVTEANPAHMLAFRRYASGRVKRFNARLATAIRAHSDAPIAHNYMGRVTEFDHFAVGDDLDIASWDSYPLGFLEDRVGATAAQQRDYARQGDPDFQAFHHDLYRGVGRGRWWVMEQQPGPVNWAPVNPAPLPGMVRLWTWEAFAHGAEAVCYFRWRQVPFAQEQMHAGLLRPDSAPAPALEEARQVAAELAGADVAPVRAKVALIFDYDADFAWATQPHGAGLSYFGLVFDTYRALRRCGLSVDILRAETRDFSGYEMILAPGLMTMSDDLKHALAGSQAEVIFGPRSAARDTHMAIPVPLPPNVPGLDVTVSHVETIREDLPRDLSTGGAAIRYLEALEGAAPTVLTDTDGTALAKRSGRLTYLGAWLNGDALTAFVEEAALRTGLEIYKMPGGLRRRETGTERFWINYDTVAHKTPDGVVPPIDMLRVSIA